MNFLEMEDLLNVPPQDLMLERIALKLPLKSLLLLALSCRRIRNLLSDEPFWERVAHRDWPEIFRTLRVTLNWRVLCHDLTFLRNLSWELIPKRSGYWPSGRWGHTMTTLDSRRILMFGGESDNQTR
jgi:hypothetical protein